MILIKSKREIEKLRTSSRITAEVMEVVAQMVAPGVATEALDTAAAEHMRRAGGRSAFKGYRDYPAHICVSVNDEVVHGIPGARVLRAGDIVSLDIGVEYDGYCGDMARTLAVGEVNEIKARLIDATRRAGEDAIAQARDGNRLYDISHAIESRACESGFSVVRDYVGHGIGARLHEEPQIPNYGTPHTGPRLKAGMTFAIEAMVNSGGSAVRVQPDGWTVVTRDGKPSAHYEDTVVITEDGPEVLTCLREKSR